MHPIVIQLIALVHRSRGQYMRSSCGAQQQYLYTMQTHAKRDHVGTRTNNANDCMWFHMVHCLTSKCKAGSETLDRVTRNGFPHSFHE